MQPKKIEKSDDRTITIVWSDDHESRYDVVLLRGQCTCAACRDEWTGERILLPSAVLPTVRPDSLESVGNYGIKISWSDGHSTGIYTYTYLRGLCGCSQCRPTK